MTQVQELPVSGLLFQKQANTILKMKKMKKRSAYHYILAALLVSASGLQAQTVNTGDMTILPNTLVSTLSDFTNTDTGDLVNDGELFVYKNFRNDGLVSFTPGLADSYVRFEGAANAQAISGTMSSEFYDVLFDNNAPQPAFALSGSIKVFGTADFLNGRVDNDSFGGTFAFAQGAAHTNTSNSSHVDGPMLKEGNEDFIFPAGDDGFFRYAAISAPDAIAASFRTKYFHQDSDLIYPHGSLAQNTIEFIDNQEYWTVDRVGGSSDIILTLSWDSSTTSQPILDDPENIHIVRWDPANGQWTDEGGIADLGSRSISTPAAVGGYGVFALARMKAATAPDEIEIFNAVSSGSDGKNDYFHIENIQSYPNNRVEIYNRWGVKLFDTRNYDSAGNVFRGYSDGRATMGRRDKLPTGTYFYVVEYEYTGDGNPRTLKKVGYLYLTND